MSVPTLIEETCYSVTDFDLDIETEHELVLDDPNVENPEPALVVDPNIKDIKQKQVLLGTIMVLHDRQFTENV